MSHITLLCVSSSAVIAVWDQDGGFMYDLHGNVTDEWSWQEYRTPRKKIIVKVKLLKHIPIKKPHDLM